MSDPLGRQPIGVSQPPAAAWKYPFVNPSVDVQKLLGDFYLAYADEACRFVPPLRVFWLYGFGDVVTAPPAGVPVPTHARDLLVVDGVGLTVFDSTLATNYRESPWGNRLLVVEWQAENGVCRCTQHTAWQPGADVRSYGTNVAPEDGELDARTYLRLPGRVTTLRVGAVELAGNLQIQAGYNVQLAGGGTTRVDGGRLVSRIELDAVPGAGLGRRPGCADTVPVLRRVNGVGPDASGNLVIAVDGCMRGQLQLAVVTVGSERSATVTEATIELHDDCTPCYDCSYFVRTYEGLRAAWERWQALANAAEAARDTFSANRQRWLDQRDCRLASPLRVVAAAEGNCKTFAGAAYCNGTDCCLAPVEVRFTFLHFVDGVAADWPDGVSLLEAYLDAPSTGGEVAYAPEVAGPVFRFTADSVGPQQTVKARLRLCVPCVTGASVGVTVTVHAPQPAGCDAPPAVSTPAAVLAAWAAAGVSATPAAVAASTRAAPLDPAAVTPECNCP